MKAAVYGHTIVLTGRRERTTSDRMPPQKKQVIIVKINPEWRQNQILRASLDVTPHELLP
jgi:hypothetical protein